MNWKQEIEEAISKEPLLDEAFIRKVQQPKKKRGPSPLIPVLVALCLVIVGVLFMQQQARPLVEQTQLTAEGLLEAYFTAIEAKDYAAFEQVSATELIASPKEIFEAYEAFDLENYTVLKVSEGAVTVRMPTVNGEAFVRDYQINEQQQKVSEQFYEYKQSYEEFVHPDNIQLTYESAPLADRVKLLADKPTDIRDGLPNKDRVLRYDDGRMMKFYVEGEHGTFYLGDMPKAEAVTVSLIPPIEEQIMVIATEQHVMYVYYSEQWQSYQCFVGERLDRGLVSYTVDGFDYPVFGIKASGNTIISTLQDGELVATNVNLSLDPALYQLYLVEVELIGSAVLVKYKEEYEQRSSYYSFDTPYVLVKQ